jgi:hypothetical protein
VAAEQIAPSQALEAATAAAAERRAAVIYRFKRVLKSAHFEISSADERLMNALDNCLTAPAAATAHQRLHAFTSTSHSSKCFLTEYTLAALLISHC